MNTPAVLRNGALGLVSGLVASAAMNGFQSGWSAIGKLLKPQEDEENESSDEPSTVKAADRLSQATAGKPVPVDRKPVAGQAVHYAFGALLGGVYGAVATGFPRIRTAFGAAYGVGVWAVADEALVPAVGLSKSAAETPASTHLYSLASHVLFGAVLDGSQTVLQRSLAAMKKGSERQAA